MMRDLCEKNTSFTAHYSGAPKAVTVQGVRNNGALLGHET